MSCDDLGHVSLDDGDPLANLLRESGGMPTCLRDHVGGQLDAADLDPGGSDRKQGASRATAGFENRASAFFGVCEVVLDLPIEAGEVAGVEAGLRPRITGGLGIFDQNMPSTTARSSCSSFSEDTILPRENSLSSRP